MSLIEPGDEAGSFQKLLEKGRVERATRFVRERFFAARRFVDLADLNAEAPRWCADEADERPCPEDRDRSVRACFEDEQPRLLTLPAEPFPCEERLTVRGTQPLTSASI